MDLILENTTDNRDREYPKKFKVYYELLNENVEEPEESPCEEEPLEFDKEKWYENMATDLDVLYDEIRQLISDRDDERRYEDPEYNNDLLERFNKAYPKRVYDEPQSLHTKYWYPRDKLEMVNRVKLPYSTTIYLVVVHSVGCCSGKYILSRVFTKLQSAVNLINKMNNYFQYQYYLGTRDDNHFNSNLSEAKIYTYTQKDHKFVFTN